MVSMAKDSPIDLQREKRHTESRPSQGFWGFREKGYLFSGIWGEGSFIFRDLGRKHSFREQGAGG